MGKTGLIRAGMGGWTFEPWDTSFYPAGLAKKKQLDYASRQVPTIEVNGTFYSTFKPPTFAKWRDESPDGFIFSLKGSRYVTNRRVLSEAGPSVEKFLTQGICELGDKLGPLLWQFAATKQFDAEDFEGFLKLLPAEQDGVPLRHALEPRHPSFCVPEFVELAARYNAAIVCAEHPDYPQIADVTGDFVYARLQMGSDDNQNCYSEDGLDLWAERAKVWASGGQPEGLAYADQARHAEKKPRDVFAYFITNGKVRAPFGAQALLQRTD